MDSQHQASSSLKQPTNQVPIDTSSEVMPEATNTQERTDTLGIVSIILSFVGMQFVGLIVAIIGLVTAKKEERSIALSLIGLILNIVLGIVTTAIIVGLLMVNLRAAQDNANERLRQQPSIQLQSN